MANKIIKYNLTSGGTIPSYIEDGGYYPKANSNASPQDWDLIGATVDGSSETGLGELANACGKEMSISQFFRSSIVIVSMFFLKCKILISTITRINQYFFKTT